MNEANEYDTLLQSEQQGESAQRRLALETAAKGNADQAAEAQRLSRQTDLPVDVVERNLDTVKQKTQANEYDALLASAPALGKKLTDLDFAKVAHDDVESLGAIEEILRVTENTGRALAAAPARAGAGLYGVARAGAEALGADTAAEWLAGQQRGAEQTASDIRGEQKGAGFVEKAALSGVESAGQTLLMLPAAMLTGNPLPLLLGMSAVTGGEAYGQARDKGVSVPESFVFASSQAAIEYATEMIPASKLLTSLAGKAGFMKTLATQLATEIPGEQVATILQDLNEWAVLNPEKPFTEYLAERPSAAAQTLIATVVGTAAHSSVASAGQAVADRVQARAEQTQAAQQTADFIKQLNTLATESKLRERNPEAFKQFVDEAAKDGPVQDIYIDGQTLAQTLQQSGIDPADLSLLAPGVAEQLNEAVATKGDVRIPVGEYAAAIAGTPLGETLLDHIRTSPEQMSQAEAKEFMQGQAEQFKEEARKVIETNQFDQAWQESAQSVENELLAQLTQANRFTKDVNSAYASMMGSFYSVQAARLGITPEEMYVRYPLRIQAESPAGGATMEQGGKDPAGMTAGQINKALDKLDAEDEALTDEFIAAGRGHERAREILQKSDPLAMRYRELSSRRQELRGEIDLRYGPGAPRRLPTKGFGPRSKGQYAQDAKDQTQTPEFEDWFGESKVVDETGKPLVVYHGTSAKFEKFNANSGGNFFSADKNYASTYGRNVGAFYLAIKNPADLDNDMRAFEAAVHAFNEDGEYAENPDVMENREEPGFLSGFDETWELASRPEVRFALAQLGYDGIIVNEGGTANHDWGRSYVAFRPEQIKSATGNRGTFDPNDPNILHQDAVDPAANLTPEQRAVYDSIERAKPGKLTADERVIESRFAAKLAEQGLDAAIEEYNARPDAEGGKVLNVDTARELSPDYLADRTQSNAVHEPASWFIKQLYARKLTEAPKAGELPLVLFTAGGTGAGKSSAIKHVAEAAQLRERAQIVYDTNMNGYDSAVKKIGQAADAGKRVRVILVYRDPVEALVNGALPRAERQREKYGSGRTVPAAEHVKTHIGAIETVKRLAAESPKLPILSLDNAHGLGEARAVALADIPTLDYNKVAPDVRAALEAEYAAGKISDETYRGFAGAESQESDAGAAGAAQGIRREDRPGTRGQPQPQREGQGPDALTQGETTRGSITFGADLKQTPSIITLAQAADLSTFLHESGHFYLEVLTDIASQPDAPGEIQQDLQTLLDWFGVKDLAAWRSMTIDQRRASHEKFARGFEAYLFEGKAPSTALGKLFQRFRAWLINVYRSAKALNVELTPEVRSVMDRMLASTDQILEAETARSYAPLFENKPKGMTDAEWKSYQDLGHDATAGAIEALERRSLRDMQWLANARGKKLKALQRDAAQKRAEVHREVVNEIRAMPVYAVQRFIRKGELPGFEGQGKSAKLSAQALADMYDTPETAPIRGQMFKEHPNLVVEEGGIHPDEIAAMFGYTSGDQMVRAILAAESEASATEGLTDQRMLERYGDLATPDAIERAANDALHNDARAKFIATELKALSKATGSRNILTKAAREFAEQTIARKKIRDIRPAQYEAAEARAARAAEKALAKNKLVEAATEKRNQLVNYYAGKAANNALEAYEKGLRYLKKFDNEGSRKNLDIDYLDQIDKLLERFDLRKGQSLKEIDSRKALAEWITAQEEDGLTPIISDELRNEAYRKHVRDLTAEEFKGLLDSVKNIEHLGRLKKKLLTAADQRDFEIAVADIAASIENNAKGEVPERRTSDRGILVDAGKLFRRFAAEHRKIASLVREIDGWKDAGAGWEYLIRNMNKAGDAEATMNEQATIALTKLVKQLDTKKLKDKVFFPQIGKSFTYEERLGIALNMGNEVNRERVMSGEGLSPQQTQMLLDTLSEKDWHFVQGVWDYLESFRPQIAEKERRLTGVEPEWVEATSVQTKYGEIKGGYFPIKYDALRSSRAEADIAAEVQKQIERGLYVRAQTRRGHLKARTESTGRPIRYDLGVITEHVTQVVHDLAWHEYLIDANRLLRSKPVDNTVRTYYGPEKLRAMTDALTDIAKGHTGAQTAFSAVFSHLRFGATISGLGWRLSTALLQPLGLTQSASRIGTKWVLKGARHWLGDAVHLENSARVIGEKSDFMRLRAKTLQREINEIRNKISGKESAVTASYFYLIQKLQLVSDIPTWWGQYEKAMSQADMTEAKAIALADQAVIDAQGSGQLKDLSGIERGGEGQKLFTVFYSFFNTTYNLTTEAVGRTDFKSPKSVALLAADLALLYAIPATLGLLLRQGLKGEWWDDDDEFLRELIAENLGYIFGTVVGLREIGSAVRALTTGGLGSYTGPASVRIFSDFAKLATQIRQGELDEAFWKALNSVGGIVFHYPAGQINQTAAGAAALFEGKTENPAALISGPPR